MALMADMRGVLLGLAAAVAAAIRPGAAQLNDYPTAARADYVFACMKTNGETQQALEQCSCSIDVIASILPCVGRNRVEPVAGAGPVRRHVSVTGASEIHDQ